MGELSTVDLRNMATTHPHGPSGPEIRQALQWAADRIDYLEGFIESYEAEEARRREGRAFNVRNDNTHGGDTP